MRKVTLITAALIAAVLLQGCTGFLTVKPQGEVIPSTDEEFAAIIHYHLNEIEGGGDEFIIGNMETIARLEGCADDLDANILPGTNLASYSGELINQRMSAYRESFEVIRDCNIVIENLKGRDTPTAKGVMAAAYSIKGIVYYNLMKEFCPAWGDGSELGIPIVETFDVESRPLRPTLSQTAEYAVAQFDKALAQGSTDPKYIFTPYIIKAFKAKTLFWAEKWDEAIPVCEDILSNSGKKLCDRESFATMMSSDAPVSEILLKSHINNASELNWYFSYIKGYISSRPAGKAFVSLFGENPEDDVRFKVSLDSKRFNTKLPEMRIRLSEILLTLAECYVHSNRAGDAIDLLNSLRSHRIRNAEPLSLDTLPEVRTGDRISVDAMGKPVSKALQAVFDERRKELFMEGDRWWELKRNGSPEWWVVTGGLKYTTRKYLYTAPIYKGDTELNPAMKQNEGYE